MHHSISNHIAGKLPKFLSPLPTALNIKCLIAITPTQALSCYCDHCQPKNCTTYGGPESACFKSVERVIENNTYGWITSFGCFSDGGTFYHMQCIPPKSTRGLYHIECCRNDFCNLDLRDPDESDDPRWAISDPPIPRQDPTNAANVDPWNVAASSIFLTCAFILLAFWVYKLISNLRAKCTNDTKSIEPSSQDSHGSLCSFKVNVEEQLKNQFINHHLNTGSSSTSSHIYTISDSLSQKVGAPHDFEHSIASIEHSRTLYDLTSGIGTNIIEPRSLARIVDSGETVPVGSGRFGRVFRGQYHGEDVAVKAFKTIDHESWQREENILKKLNHENIVRFIASETYTIATNSTETWMFLEFCPYGSLCDFLDSNEIYGPQQAIKIIYSIIKGLNYLHEDFLVADKPRIAHRDIKSKNILMRNQDTCCLADFGHAVVKVNDKELNFGHYSRFQVGTIRYMAPEILKPSDRFDGSNFDTFARSDIYQFGLVLWEICQRTALDVLHPGGPHRLPYDGLVPHDPAIVDMINVICGPNNYRPPISPHWERHNVMKDLRSLMVDCWHQNSDARTTTLAAKNRVKNLYDQSISQQSIFYPHNFIGNSPQHFNFKGRSNEFTM